jgi:hypothetical protein
MNGFAILVIVALVVLLLAWHVVRGESAPISDVKELPAQIRQVDFHAFKNLLDPRDEDYLRSHLDSSEFRKVQSMRTRAAIEYVSWTAHNASVLLRLGQAAAKNAEPQIAASGRELANIALSVRINCLLALLKLRMSLIYPVSGLSLESFLQRYLDMQKSYVTLARAQHPSYGVDAFMAL